MKGVLATDLLSDDEIPGSVKSMPEDWIRRRPEWDAALRALGEEIRADAEVSTKVKFDRPTKLAPTEAVIPFHGTVRVKTHVRRKR